MLSEVRVYNSNYTNGRTSVPVFLRQLFSSDYICFGVLHAKLDSWLISFTALNFQLFFLISVNCMLAMNLINKRYTKNQPAIDFIIFLSRLTQRLLKMAIYVQLCTACLSVYVGRLNSVKGVLIKNIFLEYRWYVLG